MKRIICLSFKLTARTQAVLVMMLAALTAARGAAADEMSEGIQELAKLTLVSTRLLGEARAEAQVNQFGFAKDQPCLYAGPITPKDSLPWTLTLEADKEYIALAAGDENALDIDMRVIGPGNRILGVDNRVAPSARVSFRTTQAGPHTIHVHLFKANATSFCGLVLLERNGWDIPIINLATALGNFMDGAGRTALLLQRTTGGLTTIRMSNGGQSGWNLFGQVLTRNQQREIEPLPPGAGLHLFLAAGCGQAVDIDLEILDQAGKVRARDIDPDATPICSLSTKAGERYRVKTLLPDSRGASLVITGVLKVDANNEQIIRPVRAGR